MTPIEFVDIGGLRLRVSIQGRGRPLLLLNGIGASLELFTPFRAYLDNIETIAIDLPGTGGSDTARLPQRLGGLADLVHRTLRVLGFRKVDVLGISWGGALAQEFAHRHAAWVRKLILAATSPGMVSLPGRPSALRVLATPRRYFSPSYYERVAPVLYGGAIRENPRLLHEQGYLRFIRPPSARGYAWQLAAIAGWSSLPWLHRVPAETLILAADDDPIIPLTNARLIACRLPRATLEVVPRGGHLFLLTHADTMAPRVARFLLDEPGRS